MTNKKMSDDRVTVYLSPFKERFQKHCAKIGQSMTGQIKRLVQKDLEENE